MHRALARLRDARRVGLRASALPWLALVVVASALAVAAVSTGAAGSSPRDDAAPLRASRADAPAMPGPTRASISDELAARRVRLNQDCERCHPQIATEWRASLHRRAHSDPVYARAYAREPEAFCRGCHAPESDPEDDASQPRAADLGVGCVTCHVTARGPTEVDATVEVLAAPRERAVDADARARAHHDLRREPLFASASTCAGCHEFPFPDNRRRVRPAMMQRTMQEHRRSSARARACASCHMPVVDGADGPHRSHRFAASRDPELIRSAASITARCEPRGVTLTITPAHVGHAFPTGDLFRRLELSLRPEADDREELVTRRFLARHFVTTRERPGAPVRALLRDDRVGARPGPSVITLELPRAAATATTRWRVAYQRVEHMDGDNPQRAVVEGELEVASGRCDPRDAAATTSAAPTPRGTP